MFKRNRTPDPVWKARVDRAKTLIVEHNDALINTAELDRVDTALAHADDDLARLDRAIASLDAEKAVAELKAALRARPNPADPDTPLIMSLRQRHETVTVLQNRRDELADYVESTLVDLDALAAKVVELSFVAGSSATRSVDDQLQGLMLDIDALTRAHQQLATIS